MKAVGERCPYPRKSRGRGNIARIRCSLCIFTAWGLQPHMPQPKLAVKRMQKAMTPINHLSSCFIVRVLLT